MKRTALRRTRMSRGSRRVGAAARERIKAGGVLAKGRESVSRAAYDEIIEQIKQRAGGRCEVVVQGLRCKRDGLDPCHVWNRSQGCPDSTDTIYWGCRFHNTQQAAAYRDGRLIVTAKGGGRFHFEVVYANDKFEARGGEWRETLRRSSSQ